VISLFLRVNWADGFFFDRERMKRRGERRCIVLISMRSDLVLYHGCIVPLDLLRIWTAY
jgi:hypothetical protein